MDRKQKIKNRLRKFLNREPSEAEVLNAHTDFNIITQIQDEEIADLHKRILILEKK